MPKNPFDCVVVIMGVVLSLAACSKPAAPLPAAQSQQPDAGSAEPTAEVATVGTQGLDAAAPAVASSAVDAAPSAAAQNEPDAAAGGDAHGTDGGSRRFAKLDKNGDGRITKDEATGRLKKRFDKVDTNHDGAIDQDELNASTPSKGRGKKHGKGKGHDRGAQPKDDTTDPAPADSTEP